MIFGYFGLAVVFYFTYGIEHSVGNKTGWTPLLRRSRDFFCIDGDDNRSTLEDQLIRNYLMSADLMDDEASGTAVTNPASGLISSPSTSSEGMAR